LPHIVVQYRAAGAEGKAILRGMRGQEDLVELTRRSVRHTDERDFDGAVAVFAEGA
jgi:hypothetical protein